jgi:hypothetical protein
VACCDVNSVRVDGKGCDVAGTALGLPNDAVTAPSLRDHTRSLFFFFARIMKKKRKEETNGRTRALPRSDNI